MNPLNLDITPLLQAAVTGYRSPDPNGSNGSLGLSRLLRVSNGVLSRKVSPNDPGSHCSPDEIVAICRETGDLAPMHAMAAQLGCLLMPAMPLAPGDISPDLARNFKELGDWLQAAATAHAADTITDNTLAVLSRELIEVISESVNMFARLKAKHDAGKPTLRVA